MKTEIFWNCEIFWKFWNFMKFFNTDKLTNFLFVCWAGASKFSNIASIYVKIETRSLVSSQWQKYIKYSVYHVTGLAMKLYENHAICNIIGLLYEYWWILSRAVYAITLLLYSNTYFFFRSVINTVNIWFFHISLLYCTRKNILIFALFLSHDNWWSRDNLILRLSFRSDCRRWWSLSVKRNIGQFDYNYSLFVDL